MKRIFINRVLAFLLIGATLTYAGCKDYDDDIGNVQTELSETAAALQEQLGALQTALTELRTRRLPRHRKPQQPRKPPMRPPKRLRQLRKPSPMPRRKPFGRLFLNASL